MRSALVLAISATLALATSGVAQAQGRHRPAVRPVAAPPLTVTKRSWLDSGNVVPVGTNNSYLTANTTLNQPITRDFAPGRFGQSTLPGQFDLAFSKDNPRGPDAGGGIFFDDAP